MSFKHWFLAGFGFGLGLTLCVVLLRLLDVIYQFTP